MADSRYSSFVFSLSSCCIVLSQINGIIHLQPTAAHPGTDLFNAQEEKHWIVIDADVAKALTLITLNLTLNPNPLPSTNIHHAPF